MEEEELVAVWLNDKVHEGYGEKYSTTFIECGYTTVKELRGMSQEEMINLRLKLEKAGAQTPQLRLIEEALAELNAPSVIQYPRAEIEAETPPEGQVISLVANSQALQIPIAQVVPGRTAGLERIFLGMGWKERDRSQGTVDVDCSVTGFANGHRLAEHTVSYLHLHNGIGNNTATIVHTGDILVGQQDTSSPTIDLERIYIDLYNLPLAIDALALEANIYTAGLTFDAIASAYVRIVNADTNQELGRMSLDDLGSNRVALFARLFKLQSSSSSSNLHPYQWHLFADFQLREALFRHCDSFQSIMQYGTAAVNDPPPVATVISNDTAPQKRENVLSTTPLKQPQQEKEHSVSRQGRKTYAMIPVAVATAAGVAASIAIFTNAGTLSASNFEPSLFETGVDLTSAVDLLSPINDIGDSFLSNCCCCSLDFCTDSISFISNGCNDVFCNDAVDCLPYSCATSCSCLAECIGGLGQCLGSLLCCILDACGDIDFS